MLRKGEKLRDHADVARPLYLELRALGLGVRVVDAPGGRPLDYGIALEGFPELPGAVERSVRRRVLANEDGASCGCFSTGAPPTSKRSAGKAIAGGKSERIRE